MILYLGGSRRMAEKHGFTLPYGTADWDYYATDTPAMRSYLELMGYVADTVNEEYLDDSATCVMRRDSIQVVLRHDAEHYRRMFEDIPLDDFQRLLWKSSPTFTGDRKSICEEINRRLRDTKYAEETSHTPDATQDAEEPIRQATIILNNGQEIDMYPTQPRYTAKSVLAQALAGTGLDYIARATATDLISHAPEAWKVVDALAPRERSAILALLLHEALR